MPELPARQADWYTQLHNSEYLRAKRHRRLSQFGRNELSRLVMATLRTAAGEPIGIEDIACRVMLARGFDVSDAALRAAIRQRLRAILTRLHKQGVTEAIGGGRGSRWKLAGA